MTAQRYDLWMYYDEWQEDEDDNGEWVKYEDHAAEITQLRADLAAERELADRLAGALEYIDDYCLAYPELESISAVSSSAIEYVDTRRNK